MLHPDELSVTTLRNNNEKLRKLFLRRVCMVVSLLAALANFLFGTFVGWAAHWVLHQRWSGPFYKSHLTHHVKNYPPTRLATESYLESGKDDGLFFFIPVSLVAVIGYVALLNWLSVSWWVYALFVVQGLLIGLVNEYTHKAYHIQDHWLNRYGWFKTMKAHHWRHHWNVRRNFGIFWFGWDRLFKTFRG